MKKLLKNLFKAVNLGLCKYETLEKLRRNDNAIKDIDLLLSLPNEHAPKILKLLGKSKSQLRQDLFVLSQLNFKRNGFFVEFGAGNGISDSNTLLLEKEFNWNGILAEPSTFWQEALKKNRNSQIETLCIFSESGNLLAFNECTIPELSTLAHFKKHDGHAKNRSKSKEYFVETISLLDLLKKYEAPKNIDYLSIDTEGSEYEILKQFKFHEYKIRVITCEHNYSENREKIYDLLIHNGYKRVYEELSFFDDWYIKI
jgi:FkbM family methyltransferase